MSVIASEEAETWLRFVFIANLNEKMKSYYKHGQNWHYGFVIFDLLVIIPKRFNLVLPLLWHLGLPLVRRAQRLPVPAAAADTWRRRHHLGRLLPSPLLLNRLFFLFMCQLLLCLLVLLLFDAVFLLYFCIFLIK